MEFNTFNVPLNIFICAVWQFEHHKVFSISFIHFQGKAGISTAEGVQIACKNTTGQKKVIYVFFNCQLNKYIHYNKNK